MAMSVQMTPQQIKKMQLQKLYQIAIDAQKIRVKDAMKNILANPLNKSPQKLAIIQ